LGAIFIGKNMKDQKTYQFDHKDKFKNNPEDTYNERGEIVSEEGLEKLRTRTKLGDPVAMRMRMAGIRKGEEQAEIDKEYIEKADKALQNEMARLSAEIEQEEMLRGK